MDADETRKTVAEPSLNPLGSGWGQEENNHNAKALPAKLKEYFASRNDIAFAFLFGSYAKGKATGRSDVDIAVFFSQLYDLATLNRITGDLETLLQKNVDLIVLNEANASVAWAALRGVPLVIRDRAFYLQYMLDISREAEDFSELLYDLWRLRREHRRMAKGYRRRHQAEG
ncbi:MAG: nucleotidyltransferase domain-containing protein [Firmicutes bacterium]|nr:nucleotidyltransferase domain-containing protein [Bacillota bacterium]